MARRPDHRGADRPIAGHPRRQCRAEPPGQTGRSRAWRTGHAGRARAGRFARRRGRDQGIAVSLRHAEGAGRLTTVTAEALGGPGDETVLRSHAEQEYAAELATLAAADDRVRP